MVKEDRKIRILFLADQLATASGGTEQHISFLLSHLSKDLYDLTFVLLRDTGFYNSALFPIEPVFLKVTSLSSIGSTWRAVKELSDLIRRDHIDIIQTFFSDSEILAILTSCSRGGAAHITTRRNMGHHHTLRTLWRTRLTDKFISGFLANCEAVRRQVEASEWVPLNKIVVIPNPLPDKRTEEGMAGLISKGIYGIGEDEQVVGIVATISWVKDHETFLRAARFVMDRKPRTKFLMIGRMDPEREPLVHQLIKSLQLESAVVLVGEHPNPIALMKLFDVGVLSSRSEGLSNTLIEYGAAGLPAVVTDVGGNSEIIVPGQTGLIVPRENPELLARDILLLLDDDTLRGKMGVQARERVAQVFEESKILDQYYQFYQEWANRSAREGE